MEQVDHSGFGASKRSTTVAGDDARSSRTGDEEQLADGDASESSEVAVSVVAASEIDVGTQYCRFENSGTMSAFLIDVTDVED